MVPLGMPMRGDAVTLGNLAGKIAMVEIASHPRHGAHSRYSGNDAAQERLQPGSIRL